MSVSHTGNGIKMNKQRFTLYEYLANCSRVATNSQQRRFNSCLVHISSLVTLSTRCPDFFGVSDSFSQQPRSISAHLQSIVKLNQAPRAISQCIWSEAGTSIRCEWGKPQLLLRWMVGSDG